MGSRRCGEALLHSAKSARLMRGAEVVCIGVICNGARPDLLFASPKIHVAAPPNPASLAQVRELFAIGHVPGRIDPISTPKRIVAVMRPARDDPF
jgi:hypothetical protein